MRQSATAFASIAFAMSIMLATPALAQSPGTFSGLPVVQLATDGRTAKLMEKLTFTDTSGLNWVVPRDTVVDGASIPQVVWSLIGGPWDGAYRDASIVHDFYCVRRTRTWQAVHRMFYEAMQARNVDPIKARLMFYAVYRFGPRWKLVTTRVPSLGFDGVPTMVEKSVVVDEPAPAYDAARFERDQNAIATGNLSLDQIEAIANAPDAPIASPAATR